MDNELKVIKLKMKALGFSDQQIVSIIEQSLAGKQWEEMDAGERKRMLKSMDNRIDFVRKFLQLLSCESCQK
jgi:hypothetical protein